MDSNTHYIFDSEMFSKKMKKLRKEAELTQQELADQMGMDLKTISNLENGKMITAPKFDTIAKLCNILNCDPSYLLTDTDYTKNIYKKIYEMTGLTEKTVKALETINNEISKDFPSGNIMIMLNLLLSDYEIVKDDIEGDEFKCYQLVYLLNALAEGLRTGYYVPLDHDNNIIENAKTGERWTTFTGEEHLSVALKNHNMACKYHREAALHEIYEYFNGFFDRIEPKKNKKNII